MASPRWPTRSRTGRAVVFRSLLAAVAATAVVLLTGVTPAHATETPGEIEKEIDKQWNELEPVIENYNAIHEKYLEQKAKADKLQKQIQPLEVQVSVALTRVNGYSVAVFENGPSATLRALLNADNSVTALDMLGVLDQMASQQRKDIAGTVKLKQKYEAQKKPIDVLVASLNDQQTSLTAQRKSINAKISSLDKLRRKVSGSNLTKLRLAPCPYSYTGDAGSRAAKFACSQIGKKYVWAAAGPNSYDCSGLTMRSWAQVGVSLPHNAYQQKHHTARISRSSLRPGDLVFYYPSVHHVAIYVGGGWMVNAPETGDVVRMAKYNRYPVDSYGRP